MALRDEKKDLDVLDMIGLDYGVVMPAISLYKKIFRAVKSPRQICGYSDGVERGYEWSICGGAKDDRNYRKARKAFMFIDGLGGYRK